MFLRTNDILLSLMGLIVSLPIFLFVCVANVCRFGGIFFVQMRVGECGRPFRIIKFRSMRADAPVVPTHLLPEDFIEPWGKFLRRSKMDELPQMLNVLFGDMSLVGPRPCLPTQLDLIKARDKAGILDVRPGMTGPAQLKGVDMSDIDRLIAEEAIFFSKYSKSEYFRCILGTIKVVIASTFHLD